MMKFYSAPRRVAHKDIDGVLGLAAKNLNHKAREKVFSNHKIIDIRKNWEWIVGSSLAMHSFPDKVRNNTLMVETDHSVFSQNIKMLEEKILEKLEDKTGIRLGQIQTKVGQIKWHSGASSTNELQQEEKSEKSSKVKDIMSTQENLVQDKQDHFDVFIDKIARLS